MDYSGWNLIDDVIIYCRPKQEKTSWRPDEDFYRGYIIDAKNKGQIETAKSWANYDTNRLLYSFKNEGFRMELYDSAGGSSQGGKLSFWNCLFTKDDERFLVGINADLLLDLLQNSTVINGIVQEEVIFATQNGRTGVIHTGMPQYQDALRDMQKKATIKKKTSKHVVGRNYYTLTENDIYLGDLYDWFEPVVGRVGYGWNDRETTVGYKIVEMPKKVRVFHGLCESDKNITSIRDYTKQVVKCINSGGSSWNTIFGETKEKLPVRTEGDIVWENNMTSDDWDTCLKEIRSVIIDRGTKTKDYKTNEYKPCNLSLYTFMQLGLSAYPDRPPEFTKEELEKFGDILKQDGA